MVFPITKMIFTWKNLVTIINRKIDFFEKTINFSLKKVKSTLPMVNQHIFQHFLLVLIVFEKVSFPIGKCFFQNTHRYSFEIMKKFFILSMGKSNFFSQKSTKFDLPYIEKFGSKHKNFNFFNHFYHSSDPPPPPVLL